MSEKIRKYIGLAVIVVLLTASYGIIKLVGSYGASVQPSSYRSFAVSAEGKATSIPDIAIFSYSAVTEGGKNIKALTDKNNAKANDIAKFLEGSKISKIDIKTTSYSVEPRTQYYSCVPDINGEAKRCPPSEIVGYTIRQSTEVKIRDFTLIGDVLNGVVVKGASSVSDLRFTNDDPTMVEDLARADAMKKAKKKAEAVALAGGFKLGKLLSVDESSYPVAQFYSNDGIKALSVAEDSQAPSIEPGSQETKANVTLRYEIR